MRKIDIIKTLKNNKAPGEDNVNAKLLKIGTQHFVTKMQILKEIWNTIQIPESGKQQLSISNLRRDTINVLY